MKHVPNIVSAARIVFALLLFLARPFSLAFMAIYLVCGVSDIIDGYLARRYDCMSRLGARIDSVGDLVMVISASVMLFPAIRPPVPVMMWVLAIAVVRVAALVASYIRNRSVLSIHTYANKAAGISIFLYPFLFCLSRSVMLQYLICLVASAAALEELLIHLLGRAASEDTRSMFDAIG